MGRQENPLDLAAGDLARFAHDLRELRRIAGNPSYREMARIANFSHSTLAAAASGKSLPSLPVTLAYVCACGGDKTTWTDRWRELARSQTVIPADTAGPAFRRIRIRLVAITAAVVTVAALAAIAIVYANARQVQPVKDGHDPYIAGCGPDQKPLERQPIYRADGMSYGSLILFYSAACHGAWGYVLGPNSPQWRVYIAAHRVDDGARADSSFSGEQRPNSWGNALSTRSGCVQVEAWVDQGPKAVTSCWRPDGPVGKG